jgi:hypothetical protein
MANVTTRQNLPDYAKPTADKIEKLGFKWEFDYEFPVPDPDKTQRLQIRDAAHLAPARDVTSYAEAMKRGDRFPPGVVTRDGRFVDFNTRARAAHKLHWPTFAAFILNVDYSRATEAERDRLQLLGASFNTTHGNRLTRAEITANVRAVAASGGDFTPERVAGLLGISGSRTASIFAVFKAEQRADRLGVPFNGSVTESNRAKLGQKSAKFTDRPWREITRLAQDAGLTSTELADLCDRVQAVTDGEDAQVAVVQAERTARDTQIANFTATGKKRPPASSELRARLGFICGYAGRAGELVEYNPDAAADFLRQVEEAAGILREVATAQAESMAGQAA